jgi:hypothetical protein
MKKIMCLTCCVCQYWGCGGKALTPHALNVAHHLAAGCMRISGFYSFIICKIRMVHMRISGCYSFISCNIRIVWFQWVGDPDAAIGMNGVKYSQC